MSRIWKTTRKIRLVTFVWLNIASLSYLAHKLHGNPFFTPGNSMCISRVRISVFTQRKKHGEWWELKFQKFVEHFLFVSRFSLFLTVCIAKQSAYILSMSACLVLSFVKLPCSFPSFQLVLIHAGLKICLTIVVIESTTFGMLAQCSDNWAVRSGLFEYVVFRTEWIFPSILIKSYGSHDFYASEYETPRIYFVISIGVPVKKNWGGADTFLPDAS